MITQPFITTGGYWLFLVHRSNDFSHWLLILDWFTSIEPKHPKLSNMSGEKHIGKEGKCSHWGL
jgi:hypothetical protein